MAALIMLALVAVVVVAMVRVFFALLPVFVCVVLPIAAVWWAWGWVAANPVPAVLVGGVVGLGGWHWRRDRADERRWVLEDAEAAAVEARREAELTAAADAAVVDINARRPTPST